MTMRTPFPGRGHFPETEADFRAGARQAWAILALAAAMSCACMLTAMLMGGVNADSMLPALVSTMHWSPFYWGQDRFGMLLPLLATPLHAPVENLLLQNGISAFLATGSFFWLAWFLLGRKDSFLGGGLALLVFVVLFSPYRMLDYFGAGQPYGQAAGLCYGGLCLFDNRMRPGMARMAMAGLGALLAVLGFWVTPSLVLTLVPLLLLRAFLGFDARPKEPSGAFWKRHRSWILLLLLVLLAFAASLFLSTFSLVRQRYDFLPLTELGGNLIRLWGHFFRHHLAFPWGAGVLAALFASGCAWLWLRRNFNGLRRIAWFTLSVLLVCLCESVVFALNYHASINDFDGRYLMLSRVLLLLAAAFPAATALGALPLYAGRMRWVLAIVLLVTPLARFGPPSLSQAREAVISRSGEYAAAAQEAGCTHFAGDYWTVWPTVFGVNQIRSQKGDSAPLWGLSERSQNTAEQWAGPAFRQNPRAALICGVAKDKTMLRYVQATGFIKPACREENGLRLCVSDVPLAYGAQMLPPRAMDVFEELPGPESVARPLVLPDGRRMVLYAFGQSGVVYRYDLLDANGVVSSYLDVRNTGRFLPMTSLESSRQAPELDFKAYGFGS